MKVRIEGAAFSYILGIIFITLKLIGKIEWSWWWIVCPFWAPTAIAVAGFVGLCVWYMICCLWERFFDK